MEYKSRRFIVTDILLILGIVLPLVAGMVIKILFIPAAEGIQITGAHIFFTIPAPLGGLPITESQVNSWLVMLTILFACLYLTHGISAKGGLKRQLLAEWIVEKTENLVRVNMGEYFSAFPPFIAAIMGLSACSSLVTLCGLFAPTSDVNVIAGWAIIVFLLITYYKMKCGPIHYLKSFGDPVAPLAPLNIISEVANPVSMTFRHYGNVLSGSVISVLIAAGLSGLTNSLLGALPGLLGDIPFLQIGLPAVLSIYFDVFSGGLQAFIFAMLTMLYVAGAFPAEDYLAKRERRKQKKLQKLEQKQTNGGN